MASIAVATVKGGFWETNGVGSLASMSGEDGQRREIAQNLNAQGLHAVRQVLFSLVAFGPGSVASKNRTRVAPAVELGGARAIETISIVNRATTPTDVNEVQTDFLMLSSRSSFGANPPVNLDRNPLGTR